MIKVTDTEVTLAGEVFELPLCPGTVFIKDENGSQSYPGGLNRWGCTWPAGTKLSISIKRVLDKDVESA
jgi:hypothetical protein